MEDTSVSLEIFLKSLRLLAYTQNLFGNDSIAYWLNKSLGEVATQTSLLEYFYSYKGLKILI